MVKKPGHIKGYTFYYKQIASEFSNHMNAERITMKEKQSHKNVDADI